MHEFTTDAIKADTLRLIQPMAIDNLKDTVTSIGSIMCYFKDNISVKDLYQLSIVQAIIANLDISLPQNILRAKYEEIKNGNYTNRSTDIR